MTAAVRRVDDFGMSAREFRTFQERQPDGQRWELVDGVPLMMAPPKVTHQKILFNVTMLLNEALGRHDPSLIAIATPGIDLKLEAGALTGIGRSSSYVPEPDIAVIDDVPDPDQRIVDSASVLVEIVSSTDETVVTKGGEPWIDLKARLYRGHAPCRAVIVIEQERAALRLWERVEDGWTETTLFDLDDELAVSCCGLRCRVARAYAHTHLAFEQQAQPRP